MADMTNVRVGDKLRVDLEIVDPPDFSRGIVWVRAISGSRFALNFIASGAAEHIPAPKVFRRGDWVRIPNSCPDREGGLVLGAAERPILSDSRTEYEVHWPDGRTYSYTSRCLEHDEAPE